MITHAASRKHYYTVLLDRSEAAVFLFLLLHIKRTSWYTHARMDMRMERIYHTPGWTGGSCL